MASMFNPGDTAFILESSRFIREVKVLTVKGRVVSLRFTDAEGGIKVHESRLFPTRDAANAGIKRKSPHWL